MHPILNLNICTCSRKYIENKYKLWIIHWDWFWISASEILNPIINPSTAEKKINFLSVMWGICYKQIEAIEYVKK